MKDPSSRKTLVLPAADARSERLSAVLQKIAVCAAYLILALCLSGVGVFPGTYPLGLALLSSVTGAQAVLCTLVGSLIGSARIADVRSIYVFVYLLLTASRVGASLWLSSDARSAHEDHPLGDIYNKMKEKRPPKEILAAVRSAFGERITPLFGENIRVRLALSAVAALFAGAWSVIGGGYLYYDLFGAVFSLFTVPLFTYLIYAGLSRNMRASHVREIGIYFICAAVTLALHSLSPVSPEGAARGFTFDFGVLAAFAVCTVITVSAGIHRGVFAALLCGAVLTPMYAPAFALGAAACGILSRISETLAILIGGTVSTAWAIYAGGFDGMALLFPPVVAACALLIPAYRFDLIRLPDGLFLAPSSIGRRTEAAAMAGIASADVTRRAESISEGLTSVASVLDALSEHLTRPDSTDMREIVESVFTFHCTTCKNCRTCPAADPSASTLAHKMTESLVRYGAVSADVVPPSLASECWNMGRILDEINLTAGHRIAALADGDKLSVTADDCSLAGDLIGSAAHSGGSIAEIDTALTEKLRPLISQKDFSAESLTVYGGRFKHIFADGVDVNSSKLGADDIRSLFEEAAGCRLTVPEFSLDGERLSMRMLSLPAFSCVSGSCSRAAGDGGTTSADGAATVEVTDLPPASVCGDVITAFESDGRYYMILSDGMGSGKEAALTSGIAVSLLERLLRSGAELEPSLKMLNHVIRRTGRECSATVDIAEIDLMSGQARFIKSGAAPSFVIRGGSIFRLQSKTVPIGIIRALDAEMIRFDIEAGDTVVMVSDGAARSYDEAPWLLDLMTYDEDITRGDETEAAKKIVAEAKKRGSCDDVTAGIVRLRAV